MIYLESTSKNPYFNLALEEYMFDTLGRTNPCFMLWQNDNTIVVGKYQNTAEEINQDFVKSHGIRVVRRLSGGGAVYHDHGNLNFTFIVGQDSAPDFNFKVFVFPVIRALEQLGVHAEFNGRNDITIKGQKFSGNSQYARSGRLLHHGCIMLDSNLTEVADALKVKEAKFESKSVKSVRSRVTTINANAPRYITMDEFKKTLLACAMDSGELKPYELTQKDLEAIAHLQETKYSTWEWNFGRSPVYNMHREEKFEAGLVTIYLQAEGGQIKDIRFYGDFFGNNDLAELEQAMVSLRLDENLEEKLEHLRIGEYMNGITAKDIAQMLF